MCNEENEGHISCKRTKEISLSLSLSFSLSSFLKRRIFTNHWFILAIIIILQLNRI